MQPQKPRHIIDGPHCSYGVLPNEIANDGSYYLVSTQAQYLARVFNKPAPDVEWTVPKYTVFELGYQFAREFSSMIEEDSNIPAPPVHVLIGHSEEDVEPYAFTANTTLFEAYCMRAQRESTRPATLESEVYHEECIRRLHLISPPHAALATDPIKERAALALFNHEHMQLVATPEDWSEDEFSFSLRNSLTRENMLDPLITEAIGQQTATRLVMRLLIPAMRAGEPMTPELAHECLVKGMGNYAIYIHGHVAMGSTRFDEIAQCVIMHSPKYGTAFADAYGEIEGVVLALDRAVWGDDTPPAPPNLRGDGRPAPKRT